MDRTDLVRALAVFREVAPRAAGELNLRRGVATQAEYEHALQAAWILADAAAAYLHKPPRRLQGLLATAYQVDTERRARAAAVRRRESALFVVQLGLVAEAMAGL